MTSNTANTAEILAALLPPGLSGSVSTVPGTFKPCATPDAPRLIAENIARHVATLAEIRQRTGRTIVLALEPEPCCFLETVEETVAFFRHHLYADAAAAFLAQHGAFDHTTAREALRRNVGILFWDNPSLGSIVRADESLGAPHHRARSLIS